MNSHFLFILIFLSGLVLVSGCISHPGTGQVSEPMVNQSPTPDDFITQISNVTREPIPATTTPSLSTTPAPITPALTPGSSPTLVSRTERAPDMHQFISVSFPRVSDVYLAIKNARTAMEWKKVQDQALALQILIQELKKNYQLEGTNPEKTVYSNLSSREQIVFLKYISYLNDMENFAINLKNSIYYQEKGSDPQALQTAKRYQNQAAQYEKQSIAEVKTISDYCNDFNYTFMNPVIVQYYRYV